MTTIYKDSDLETTALQTNSTVRRLGRLERYFTDSGLTIRAASLVEGKLDVDKMAIAFRELATRNPVLGSVVDRDQSGYFFRNPRSTVLHVTVRNGNARTFVDELSPRINPTTHLAELEIVRARNCAAIALTICHNVVDMTAMNGYFNELWSNYTELVNFGSIASQPVRPIPHSAEHWLDPRDAPHITTPALPTPANTAPTHAHDPQPDVRDRVHLEFSPDTTQALRQVTKENGTTVHAAVAGAILTAERSLIERDGPIPMALRSSVDLRRRIAGVEVGPLESTALIGMVTTQLYVNHDDSPLSVGALVVEDIGARIADQTAIYSSVQPPEGQRPAVSYAVNGGEIPDIPTPADVEIVRVAYGSNKCVARSAPPYYGSWTFGGRLNIDIGIPQHAMSPAARRMLADGIRTAIMSIAEAGSAPVAGEFTRRAREGSRRPHRRLAASIRRLLTAVFIVASLIGLTPSAYACSRVAWLGPEQRVVTGRTMDWPTGLNEHLYVIPRGLVQDGAGGSNSLSWTTRYGAVAVAGTVVPGDPIDAVFDGMNETGLVANLLYLKETYFGPRPDESLPRLSVAGWASYVLTNFATVNQVVDAFTKPSVSLVPTHFGAGRTEYPAVHLAVTDATGDTAILEYLDGRLNIHHGRQYQVMTNSPSYDQQLQLNKAWEAQDRDQVLPGSIQSQDRFARASYYLSRLPATTDERQAVAGVFSVIRNVQVPMGGGAGNAESNATQWVSVADAAAKKYYFNSTSAQNIIWLDLEELDLAPGSGLRAVPVERNYTLSGNVAADLTSAPPIDLLSE